MAIPTLVKFKPFPSMPNVGCVREEPALEWSWQVGALVESVGDAWKEWLGNMETYFTSYFDLVGDQGTTYMGRAGGLKW
eukprot:782124-Prorocentrum_lima.AAC.1